MPNQTPPNYWTLQLTYPYAQIFLLTYDLHLTDDDDMFAFADLLGIGRDYFAMTLAMLTSYTSTQSTPPPLLCPANTDWQNGYQAAKEFVDRSLAGDTTVTQAGVIAAHHTTPWFLQAGGAYYYFDGYTGLPTGSNAGLLANLANFLAVFL